MPFIESAREFHVRQGGDCVEVGEGVEAVFVYSNGATQERRGGVRNEPPQDPHELAKLVLRYWEERVRQATEEFDTLKENLSLAARSAIDRGFPPPPASELDKLHELKATVRTLQKRLAQARKEAERTVPAEKRRVQKVKALNQAEGDQFLGSLKNIKL
jgi:hypothetical protein